MNIVEKAYNWAYGLTPRKVTTHLILHNAAAVKCTADGIHAYHLSKGWAGIAYHYFVAKDGTIYRGRPENVYGGHTTNWNYCSIGICFEGNFDLEFMPQAQIDAGAALAADIRSRYPGIIVGKHSDYGCTSCPGKNFPFAYIVDPADEGAPEEVDTSVPSEWAKEAWEWAKAKGITDGSRPHDTATREEIVTLIWRAMQ